MMGKISRCMMAVWIAGIIFLALFVFNGASGSASEEYIWVSVPQGVTLSGDIHTLEDYGSFRLVEIPYYKFVELKSQFPGVQSLEYMKSVGLLQGSFDPLRSMPHIPERYAADQAYYAKNNYYLVQMRGPVKDLWRSEISSYGRIMAYYPHSTYLVKADQTALARIHFLPYVRWVGIYEPYYKLEPALLEEKGRIRVVIEVFKGEEISGLITYLKSHGGLIEDISITAYHSRVIAHVDDGSLSGVAMIPEVKWIQGYHDGEFYNGQAQWVIQSGQSGKRPIWDHGLYGENQTVGYGDTGLDYDHSFFRDPSNPTPGPNHRKVIGYKHWASDDGDGFGHGTHVAGSIAGNDKPVGGSSPNIGEAPEAKLFVDDVSNDGSDWAAPSDLNTFFIESYNAGARLHSNSWGYPREHTYTDAASDTDEFMWNHKDMLIVIAAGNERAAGQNSLRSPGLAKNVVTVGATANGASANDMASFSSVGPTNPDGRLKPTVCAPGVELMSAESDKNLGTNNSGEVAMSGTSMATPTTAGGIALIRQYFTEGWYPTGKKNPSDGFIPSAALLKATVMAGAVEITGSGSDYNNEGVYPNNSQGWGRVNLDNSLYFDGDLSKLVIFEEKAGISTGETRQYSIGVLSDKAPFKIILVWTDYFGQPNANPAIVNNLDMEVQSPDSKTYLGNNFQGKNPGHSVPGGNADTKNVEEGVILPDGSHGLVTGVYQVTIKGTNVPQGPQPFALVAVGDVGFSVDHVAITPAAVDTEVGTTVRLKGTAYDASNQVINGIPFDWNISDPSLGNITKVSGKPDEVDFQAGTTVGTGTITAIAFGKTATAPVNLKPGPYAKLKVTPSEFTVKIKETQSLTVEGADKYGNTLPLPGQVTWQVSSEINGSSVSGSGSSFTFTAGTKAGTGRVIASCEGKSGEAKVHVLPGSIFRIGMEEPVKVRILDSVNLTGYGYDEYDNPIAGNTFDWSLEDPSLGTISPTRGENVTFTAGTKATVARVKISMESRVGYGNITILPGDPVKVDAYPDNIETDPFTQVTLNAVLLDSYGNSIESMQIYWRLSSGFGRLVNQSGSHVKFESMSIFGAEGTAIAGFQTYTDSIHIVVRPWYILFFSIGGIIALIIAIAVIKRIRKIKCQYCGAKIPRKSVSCPVCGVPVGGPSFGGSPLPGFAQEEPSIPPGQPYAPPGSQQYPPGYQQYPQEQPYQPYTPQPPYNPPYGSPPSSPGQPGQGYPPPQQTNPPQPPPRG